MSRPRYIYGLWDPRTGDLRYIGKSIDPNRRSVHRISRAKHGTGINPVHDWIRELLGENLRPILEVLEEATKETWQESEKEWIRQCRELGIDLLNVHDGGGGLPSSTNTARKGKKLSKEHREAISKGVRGTKRSEETRRRMSEAKKRLYADPEERRKQSERMKGHPVSEETREKLKQANLGKRHTEESKRKVGDAFRGTKLSKEHKRKISDANKQSWARRRRKERQWQLSLW